MKRIAGIILLSALSSGIVGCLVGYGPQHGAPPTPPPQNEDFGAFGGPAAGGSQGLASLEAAGKVQARWSGTGEVMGQVATLELRNLTTETLSVYIAACMLLPADQAKQKYVVPGDQTVALAASQVVTLPVQGVCVSARKPPVPPSDGLGGLTMAPGSKGVDEQIAAVQGIVKSVRELQASGRVKTPLSGDRRKEFDALVLWAGWVLFSQGDEKPIVEEDLARVVIAQMGKPSTPEEAAQVAAGVKELWDAIKLIGAQAKPTN